MFRFRLSVLSAAFLCGCTSEPNVSVRPVEAARGETSLSRGGFATTNRPPVPRSREKRRRIPSVPGLKKGVAKERVSLYLEEVSLREMLGELARSLDLELLVDDVSVAGLKITLRVEKLALGELLEHLETMFPIHIYRESSLLRIEGRSGPTLSLLIYPLPGGLVRRELPSDFSSLRQLSFISRSQREGGMSELTTSVREDVQGASPSHLESFLQRLQELLPWPEGSAWYLDRRQNLLFIRSNAESLTAAEICLDRVVQNPVLVQIDSQLRDAAYE